MVRSILLVSPFVFAAVVSCGESSTLFDEVTAGSGGTNSSVSGASMGGQDGQSGSSVTAGASAKGGSTNGGGANGNGGTNGKAGNGNAGNAGNGNSGGATNQNQGGTPASAGTMSDAAGSGPDGAGAGAAGMGAGGEGNGALCPDIFGNYVIKDAKGTSCNALSKDAPQAIDGTDVSCFAHFVSDPADGPQGVNGSAVLDADGNFTGATLFLDGTPRTPCSGTWNAQMETMTVKCGGGGPGGDLCTLLLERK